MRIEQDHSFGKEVGHNIDEDVLQQLCDFIGCQRCESRHYSVALVSVSKQASHTYANKTWKVLLPYPQCHVKCPATISRPSMAQCGQA